MKDAVAANSSVIYKYAKRIENIFEYFKIRFEIPH